MTTSVNIGVRCPNVHKAAVIVQHLIDGAWVEQNRMPVEIGTDKVLTDYVTDTRRIVIEETPENSNAS